jgi:hypothetical protein
LLCEASGATYTLENDQWPVHAADGVVAYPRRHLHHAGVHNVRHGGGGEVSSGTRVRGRGVLGPQRRLLGVVVVGAVRSKWEL